jgi:hypothetical protein
MMRHDAVSRDSASNEAEGREQELEGLLNAVASVDPTGWVEVRQRHAARRCERPRHEPARD